MTLYYEERGGREPACVLVSGFAAQAGFWTAMLPDLARHRQIIIVDPAARGAAVAQMPGYTVADLAQDVAALLCSWPSLAKWLPEPLRVSAGNPHPQ